MRSFWRVIKYLILFVLVVFLADALIVFGIGNSERNAPKADAVIILGAAINTPALYNRSLEGLKMYEEGRVETLVLSGGRISDKDISEAQYMEKTIKKNAKVLPKLILEQESHSTYDNIMNSKKLIPGAKSVVIVSDRFHVARGVLMARAAGFEDVYWSSPEPYYYTRKELGLYYLREMAGMIAYIPKFLSRNE
jgi:vancomycin permeability regulator SanA